MKDPRSRRATNMSLTDGDWMVAGFILAGALGHVDLWPAALRGFSVGDALLAVLIPLAGLHLLAVRAAPRLPRGVLALAIFWAWTIAGYFLLSTAGDPVFSEVEWAKSFLQLSYHLTAGVAFLAYLKQVDPAKVERTILNVLTVVGLIAVYIYIVMTFHLPLPYTFLWFNQPAENAINSFFTRGSGFVVARGIFSEPSYLGIFQNLGWTACLFMRTGETRIPVWKHLVVLASILLTFSLSAYLLLLLNLTLGFFAGYRRARRIAAVALIAVMIILIPAAPQFSEAVVARVGKMAGGRDPSVNARLFGSWEPVRWYLRTSPVTGVGLGQYDIAQARILTPLRYEEVIRDREGWNGLAYAVGTTGVVGAAALCLALVDMLIRNPVGGLFFVAMLYLRGDLLSLVVWVFYALLHYQGWVNRETSAVSQNPTPVRE